jgi:hypothetical protein
VRIYRLFNGKQWPAHTDREGRYVLGDPKHGNKKHLRVNKIYAATEEEAISLVRMGHSIWVKSISAPVLVRDNLYIDGAQYT